MKRVLGGPNVLCRHSRTLIDSGRTSSRYDRLDGHTVAVTWSFPQEDDHARSGLATQQRIQSLGQDMMRVNTARWSRSRARKGFGQWGPLSSDARP